MKVSRRQWLQSTASLAVGGVWSSSRLWAAPAAQSRLVVVMLRGAYDGLSALVPYDEPFYYESRPTIAIARPRPEAEGEGALRLDGRWALHPMLANNAGDLWLAGQLAFVPFCGTGFVSRSHFQAQDWMESGKLPEQRPNVNEGFLNRLVSELGGTAVGFTQNLPVALRGAHKVVNAPISGRDHSPQSGSSSGEFLEQVTRLYQGHALESLVREGLGLRQSLSVELMTEMDSSGRDALPAAGFALEAVRVARHMREHPQLNIAFIDVGGWDTHAGQGAEQGSLAGRLGALGNGLEFLARELGQQWRNTVVVVLSEFGRTFRENGSKGTDHGHGNVLWVAGGAVKGGSVRGEQGRLDAASLHQGRDMPVLNEYRAVLGGLFAGMFDLKAAPLERVFPGALPRNLQLV